MAGKNGVPLWGATLYDFYHVCPVPDIPNGMWRTTSSRMLAWMSEIGETEYAKDDISWAKQEPDPQIREPCDVLEVIKELRVRLGVYEEASMAMDDDEYRDSSAADLPTASLLHIYLIFIRTLTFILVADLR